MQGHWTSGQIPELALQRRCKGDSNWVSSVKSWSNVFLHGGRSLPLLSPVVDPETESACVGDIT